MLGALAQSEYETTTTMEINLVDKKEELTPLVAEDPLEDSDDPYGDAALGNKNIDSDYVVASPKETEGTEETNASVGKGEMDNGNKDEMAADENQDENIASNSDTESETATTASDEKSANQQDQSTTEIPLDTSEDEVTSTSNTLQTTSEPPTPSEFKCPGYGRYPYPNSCSNYYYCWDDTNYAVFSCHKAFNPQSRMCGEDFSTCALAPTCETDGQVLPFPGEKTAFFECRKKNNHPGEEELRKQDCAHGREFDAELGYCKISAGYEWLAPPSDESSEQFECHGVGIFIDFASETRYIECTVKNVAKGTFKKKHCKCPKNMVFNWELKGCVPLIISN